MSDFQLNSQEVSLKKSGDIPKSKQLLPGARIRVYWNSNKKCFSVMRSGRVISHADYMVLHDCKFIVREAGNKRARKEGVKNVHAFVEGTVDFPYEPSAEKLNEIVAFAKMPSRASPKEKEEIPVYYNPWRDTSFWYCSKDDGDRVEVKSTGSVYLRVENIPTEKGLVKRGKISIVG